MLWLQNLPYHHHTDRLNANKVPFYVNKWVESTAATQVLQYIVFFGEKCSAYLCNE